MVKVEVQATLRKKAASPKDPQPLFCDVARKITGDDNPPLWLVEHLERWAPSLAMDRGVAAMQPTKAKMREKLQAIKDATSTLIDALNDSATRDFLDEAPDEITYHGQMDHMLRDLARRAEQSIGSLSTADGKTKPGRNKAMPRRASHPKSFCAAIIAEAWMFCRGEEPAPKNQDAAAAAEMYWTGCAGVISIEPAKNAFETIIGEEAKSWGLRLNRWRHHFIGAKGPALDSIRGELRRHLMESKRRAEIFAGNESA
jgi:hypothetical protein